MNTFAKLFVKNNTKYFQTLYGHSKDGLILLKEYFRINNELINEFCTHWQIDPEKFRRNLFMAVALHDIGKLTREFQANIQVNKASSKYPHPFFALPVLASFKWDYIVDYPVELCAILGHHTQLYREIYNSLKIAKEVHYLDEEIHDYFEFAVLKLYNECGFKEWFALPEIIAPEILHLRQNQIQDRFIKGSLLKFNFSHKERYFIKSVFTFFFSILQTCDDYASAHFSQFISTKKPTKQIFDAVLTSPDKYVYNINYSTTEWKNRLLGKHKPFQFQQELLEKKPYYGFLFAPCGRGKTEASLLWANEIMKAYHKNKIIFALPTQTTCNAMFDRLGKPEVFSEQNVGLFHGKSFITIKNKQREIIYAETDDAETDVKSFDVIRDETFKGNVFFKPITVTTIDHLAYAFIHGFSQSDFACGNLQNAVIIFDEIHYYEKHTLEVLLSLFFVMRKMNIPHLLMTGTAPDFLLKELRDIYKLITDDEGLLFEPFYIINKEQKIISEKVISDDVLQEIYEDYSFGNKIFIILNTVEKAQLSYQQISNYFENKKSKPKIILYHSRFTYKDRVRKENDIYELVKKSPCIVVATQVIEISLNISCDVMYSEIAPADALGQRAGRLNRSGKNWKNGKQYKLKIFAVDSEKPYPEQLVQNALAFLPNGPVSYQQIKEFCDKVYSEIEIQNNERFRQCFRDNIVFGDHYHDICWGEDEGKACKVRDDSFRTIEVVPSKVWDDCIKNVERGDFISEYKVRIPYYLVGKDIYEYGDLHNFSSKLVGNEKLLVTEYKYTFEIGIDFNKIEIKTEIW
ncbi:MAG: CRISPR-associated helicase Cas3' [Candidatus Lokiarchaeota archaeon]|nr:CRISPR-associated helicase Cas3' [Candidatus Lokiarchaeota archaeon]